jgi:orotate phosphoribosyltransferase
MQNSALCVIDRQEGGAEALAGDGISLRALLTRRDLEAAGSALRGFAQHLESHG